MNGQLLDIACTRGTPSYVYFASSVRKNAEAVQSCFGGRFVISYAVKSNPNCALLRFMKQVVAYLDISSLGEMRHACDAGWEPGQMSFTGPGKSPGILRQAVCAGVGEIILESVREATDLADVCRDLGRRQAALIRIAPASMPKGFGDWMAGKPSQFGIDEEVAPSAVTEIVRLPGIDVLGFHIYSGTQCLIAESVIANYANFIRLFRQLAGLLGRPIRKLVFGSGLGVAYHEGDRPLDLARIAAEVNPMLDDLRSQAPFKDTTCVLETGRYLVAEAGVFLIRVLHLKQSRGTTICVCDAGMNHNQMAAGRFGMVIPKNYIMANLSNPDGPKRKYHVAGPLCTTLDLLGRDALISELRIGDVVAVYNTGAYGPTASPLGFISFDPPGEIVVHADGYDVVPRTAEAPTISRDCE